MSDTPTTPASPATLHLSAPPTDFKPFPGVLGGLPKEVAGQPAHYFRKELIKAGDYENHARGFTLSADRARIQRWADTGNRMIRAGQRVPVNVDHSDKARDAVGKVVEFKAEGDTLYGLIQLIGENAELAATNDVSVGICPDFTDGENRHWGDACVHVALTPVPVVPGQAPFVQAASRTAAPADDVLTLAAATPNPRSASMALTLNCSEEHMSALRKLIPGGDDLTPENCMGRVVQHLHTMSQMDDDDAGGPDAVATMSRADISSKAAQNRKAWKGDVARLTSDNTALRGQVQELSAKVVKPLDKEAEEALIDAAKVKFDNLVARGAITPAVKEMLFSTFVSPAKGKANTLGLSRAANPAGDKPLAFVLADILADNKALPLGEQTGLQALSRHAPDEDPAEKARDAVRQKMLAAANGTGR